MKRKIKKSMQLNHKLYKLKNQMNVKAVKLKDIRDKWKRKKNKQT